MRITKTIAEDVANQLCAEKWAELDAIKKQEAEFITVIYEASLSDLIKKAFEKHKGFLYATTSIRLSGEGLSQGYKYYQLTKQLPQCNSCGSFPISADRAKVIIDLENQIEEKQSALNELRRNIEVALFNLRTYGNVEKEFPEAFKLLPAQNTNTALAINIQDIRALLKP